MLCVLLFTACERVELTKNDCVGKWVCEDDATKYFVLNADGTADFYNMCFKDVDYPEELTLGNPDGGKSDDFLPVEEVKRRVNAFKCIPITAKQKWSYYAESYWGIQRQQITFDLERIDDTSQRLWGVAQMIEVEDGVPKLYMRMSYMWGDPDMFYNVKYKKVPDAVTAPAVPMP